MSDKVEGVEKLRSLLSVDYKELKKSRSENEKLKSTDVIDGLKSEKEILISHGGAIKKFAEIVEALNGQTVSQEHIEIVSKYLTYLRNQLNSVQQTIKLEEEAKEIDTMF